MEYRLWCVSCAPFLNGSRSSCVEHIMGHFYLTSDEKGDSSWPLWGLSMRIIQAVSTHSKP